MFIGPRGSFRRFVCQRKRERSKSLLAVSGRVWLCTA